MAVGPNASLTLASVAWVASRRPGLLPGQSGAGARRDRRDGRRGAARHLQLARRARSSAGSSTTIPSCAPRSRTDADFAGTSRAEEGKGHGRREKRAIRTTPQAA